MDGLACLANSRKKEGDVGTSESEQVQTWGFQYCCFQRVNTTPVEPRSLNDPSTPRPHYLMFPRNITMHVFSIPPFSLTLNGMGMMGSGKLGYHVLQYLPTDINNDIVCSHPAKLAVRHGPIDCRRVPTFSHGSCGSPCRARPPFLS